MKVVIDGVEYTPMENKEVEQKILSTGRYGLEDLAKALLKLHEKRPWWTVDVSLNERKQEIIINTRGFGIWDFLGGEIEE